MTKKYSTKRSLIASILVLCLCLTSFIGTTFAWFTDSVTSSGNIIKSGTLDVELYYANANEDPASASWNDASIGQIFNNDKWEPGYVEAKHLKIANEGTLALKYQLAIIPNGTVSKLAEVIDVYLYEIADTDANATKISDRSVVDASMYVGTLADVINSGIVRGNVLAKAEYTTTIVLKMREEAGNEYQNLSIGSNFAVQLLATQMTAENDSFGNDYDKAAPWMGEISQPQQDENGVFQIGSAEELAWYAQYVNGSLTTTFAARAVAGHDAVLTADIDLNNLPWTPIGHTLTAEEKAAGHHPFDFQFQGSSADHALFDGQGHTVYNLNVEVKENAGLFGVAVYAAIKNVNVDGAVITSNHFAGTILAQGYAKVENCHVKNSVVTCTPELVDGAWDNGDKVGGVVGKISEANSVGTYGVIDCSAENVNVSAYRDAAGILGYAGNYASVTGNSVKNLSLIHNTTHDYKGYDDIAKYNVNAVVGDSTRSPGVYVDNNTYENVSNSEIQIVYIYDLADFAEFGKAVNNNTKYGDVKVANNTNVLVEVMEDIDMTNAPAIQGDQFAIGNGNNNQFQGTFDGNGHTISNYSIRAAWTYNVSLFRTVGGNFTMKDITFYNCSAAKTNNREASILVGTVGGGTITFDNVDIKNSSVSGVGGAALYVGKITEGALYFIDCDVENSTLTASNQNADNAIFLSNGYSHHDYEESGVFVENCKITNVESTVNGVKEAVVAEYNYIK